MEAIGRVTSMFTSIIFVQSMASNLIPVFLKRYFSNLFDSFLSRFSTQIIISVSEFDGVFANQIFKSAETYLATKISYSTRRICLSKYDEDDCDELKIKVDQDQEVIDFFQGIKFRWRLSTKSTTNRRTHYKHDGTVDCSASNRFYEISTCKKHKEICVQKYLPYVMEQAKKLRVEAKKIKLYCNEDQIWYDLNFNHPSRFETMAMEEETKRKIIEDLDRFRERGEYYNKVGKPWKRGYLLYGPPGTGKSSLVAAMANYLKYDVYNLTLSLVKDDAELLSLLVGIQDRSILVMEDIDCALKHKLDRQKKSSERKDDLESDSESSKDKVKVTLSGLLNFVDGLWSSCGSQRITVFTTNHKEKLDPALLRPGRMDMHIHMDYCSPCAFRVFASNYHSTLEENPLFEQIDGLLEEVKVTPAEVAGELMKSDDHEIALNCLIELLVKKKKECNSGCIKAEADEENGKILS